MQKYELAYKDYKKGMKYKDIASKYDVSLNTVKSWKQRQWKDLEKGVQPSEKSVHTKATIKRVQETTELTELSKTEKETLANYDLTEKQRLFCLYYSRTFNATSSYQKAYGCDYQTALSIGYRLLGKVGVKDEIARLKQARVQKEMLSQEDIFQKYMEIAFADITDFVEFGVQPLNVDGVQIEDVQVSYVALKDSKEVDGTLISEVKKGKDGVLVKLPDRMKALEWLDKHMGLANEEQKERIALLKAQRSKLEQRDETDKPINIVFTKASDKRG